mmetsp:Transcript_8171/g.16918  ORF Transcript_8171/g.16918 Transcript_8171/m.16918 type:complete len:123 (+) Transcript_8171:409-777(+)
MLPLSAILIPQKWYSTLPSTLQSFQAGSKRKQRSLSRAANWRYNNKLKSLKPLGLRLQRLCLTSPNACQWRVENLWAVIGIDICSTFPLCRRINCAAEVLPEIGKEVVEALPMTDQVHNLLS